ncbi:hypothetical protein GWG65_30130 [Bradyrhizobium sp. CSA207]|uniref:hypothetical protein n=1 Tax=Bradyrhizobium sp. CSA207 TaxID=2698826 RepID=UPI0023B11277|nr:hypothetical protein [Bradyrhizobium sp. CSA207]MDE5445599.1 hypothetical protein [Bradyrhizobium sp. CSA207]
MLIGSMVPISMIDMSLSTPMMIIIGSTSISTTVIGIPMSTSTMSVGVAPWQPRSRCG